MNSQIPTINNTAALFVSILVALCPLGEHPGFLYTGLTMTCADVLSTPRKCYTGYTEKMCCQSCPQVSKPNNREGCEYGDKNAIW